MIGKVPFRSMIVAAAALFLSADVLEGGTSYRVVNLGSLDGKATAATALNDRGEVVGWSEVDVGFGLNYDRAFLWTPEVGMRDLGITPGYSGGNMRAQGISEDGAVTGWSGNNDVFVWDSVTGIRTVASGLGYDINSSGIIAGFSSVVFDDTAFTWDSENGVQVLPLPMGYNDSRAYAVNEQGRVVGGVGIDSHDSRAIAWDPVVGMIDIGLLPGGSNSLAKAINEYGEVAGTADSQTRAFFWSPLNGFTEIVATDPAIRVSHAYGMNDLGDVVGAATRYEQVEGGTVGHNFAFFWNPEAGFVDLNDWVEPVNGCTLQRAYDINNKGQIVGFGEFDNGKRGFLLNVIPEPSSIIGLISLLVSSELLWWRRGVGSRHEPSRSNYQ